MLALCSIWQSPRNTCKEWVKEQCEPHSFQPTAVEFQLHLRRSASSNAGEEGKIAQRQNGLVTGVEEVDTGNCYLVDRLRCPYFQRYNDNCLESFLCIISPPADVSGFPREGSEARTAECNVQGRHDSLLELVLGKAFLWAKNTIHNQLLASWLSFSHTEIPALSLSQAISALLLASFCPRQNLRLSQEKQMANGLRPSPSSVRSWVPSAFTEHWCCFDPEGQKGYSSLMGDSVKLWS